jgi:hypothetical protein
MRRLLFLPALALLSPATEAPSTPETALASYRDFKRLTKESKWVGAEFATLCDGFPAERVYGLHAFAAVHYYTNPTAEAHRQTGSKAAWPAGSVLVKEKLSRDLATSTDGKPEAAALAGMIKGAPGSSPKTGDWQFFYFDNKSSGQRFAPNTPALPPKWIKSDKPSACLDCHASGGRDYVFGRFEESSRPPEGKGRR